jgi:hypothetical protein
MKLPHQEPRMRRKPHQIIKQGLRSRLARSLIEDASYLRTPGLFAEMSQHRGNRWSDFVDRCQQLIMRYAEAVRPIVPLRRIVHVDHGWGFHPSLGRDDRSHCCENDHRRRVSRYGNSPNAAMKPALTKGKHRHRAWRPERAGRPFIRLRAVKILLVRPAVG